MLMKVSYPKDGDYIDLTRKIETPDFSTPKKWKPNEGQNHTMLYGRGIPTPSKTPTQIAEEWLHEFYPYLPKGSDEWNRRFKEALNR